MNLDYYLKKKYEENIKDTNIREVDLYENITNSYLKYLFAYLHNRFNYLFEFMKEKKEINCHYNADQSRELISLIK